MTRVNRATFVLLQLCLICIYACSCVCYYVYMYPYFNDKSQLRHFCLVTVVSHIKYMAHSCNKTKVARLTFVIEIWIHICTHSKHVHVRGSCNKTKVARLTFVIEIYMCIYIQT